MSARQSPDVLPNEVLGALKPKSETALSTQLDFKDQVLTVILSRFYTRQYHSEKDSLTGVMISIEGKSYMDV